MGKKSKILWVTDGVGWGYDNFAAMCSKRLPEYDHIIVSARNEGHASVIRKLNNTKADIVMCMNPSMASYFHNYQILKTGSSKIVSRLSSLRIMKIDRNELCQPNAK